MSAKRRPKKPAIRRLEFHLSYECVQSCPFCSERGRMERFGNHPVRREEIAKALARMKRRGIEHVTFTGGEPTLHPHFVGALRAAKRLGMRTYVTTNGSRMHSKAFSAKVLPHLDEMCLSIHGHTAAVHDRAAGTRGSFSRVLKTVENVRRRRRIFLLTNTVVTRWNIGHLEDILGFILKRTGAKHCLISNLAPEGAGLARYAELSVRLSTLKSLVEPLSAMADASGAVLRFFGVPVCALGKRWRNANDLYFSPRVTIERLDAKGRAALTEVASLRPVRERVYTERCADCRKQADCGGVFREYVRLYGDDELEPF